VYCYNIKKYYWMILIPKDGIGTLNPILGTGLDC